MTTSADIANQALVALGRRVAITALTQDSMEAKTLNTVYNFIQDWCHSLANWNFARKTAVLTQTKATTPPPPPAWTNADPSPPWIYQYSLPADYIKAIYLTNNDINAGNTSYVGEPKRFAIGSDTGSSVLLTNEASAVLVYTSRISDPTLWPAYFERLVVTALAWKTCASIQGPQLVQYFDELTTRHFLIADQINREEGLVFGDTTPEWIQALGIDYPYRRHGVAMQPPYKKQPQGAPSDNSR